MAKILIVEDDEEIAMLERDYLEIEGFQAQVISDGGAAEEAALTGAYDLILLDLMLPGRSGYEVCRRIRDQVDVPILMVTARTESVDKIRGLGLGADDYIGKPFLGTAQHLFPGCLLYAHVGIPLAGYLDGMGIAVKEENSISRKHGCQGF